MSGTPDGTPRDTNGEGRWRLQTLERAQSEMRADLNTLIREHAVHKAQTAEFQSHTKDRWREDDRRRREREREFDEVREEILARLRSQDEKLERNRKMSTAAAAAFLTTALSGLVSVLLILANQT